MTRYGGPFSAYEAHQRRERRRRIVVAVIAWAIVLASAIVVAVGLWTLMVLVFTAFGS